MLKAKFNLPRLLEAIEPGVERAIVIARNGRPAARAIAMHPAPPTASIGIATGLFEIRDHLDTSNPEIARLCLAQEAS